MSPYLPRDRAAVFGSLATLTLALRELGIDWLLCKQLAENDNSKQQIYLGGSFVSLNLIPFDSVEADEQTGTFKASIRMFWMRADGIPEPAVHAKLILYPQYPEVRLSGFLRGCSSAPSESMRHIARADRRFNNGPDGRLIFFGVRSVDKTVFAYLALPDSAVAREFAAVHAARPFGRAGVFLKVPAMPSHAAGSPVKYRRARLEVEPAHQLPLVSQDRTAMNEALGPMAPAEEIGTGYALELLRDDPRGELIARLCEIHQGKWHWSRKMRSDGSVVPYRAQNGAGYTLEALFGIIPNGNAEPDFDGWELKAFSKHRKITLMTPQPDGGYYKQHGNDAFVRRYGHPVPGGYYFTGVHKVNVLCKKTGQVLRLFGYNPSSKKIEDVTGGIELVDEKGERSARWSFEALIKHWGEKHAMAAYVPYDKRGGADIEYRYGSPALLGEGTDFSLCLAALQEGKVVYDPGSKVGDGTPSAIKRKVRSQFRTTRSALHLLYRNISEVELGDQ